MRDVDVGIARPCSGICKRSAFAARQQIGMIHHSVCTNRRGFNQFLGYIVYTDLLFLRLTLKRYTEGIDCPFQIRRTCQRSHQPKPSVLHDMCNRHTCMYVVLQRTVNHHFMQRRRTNDRAAATRFNHTTAQRTGAHIHRTGCDQNFRIQPQLLSKPRINAESILLCAQNRRIFVHIGFQPADFKRLRLVLACPLI